MEPPLIESFFEKPYKIKKSPAWCGIITEGEASPSDFHKTANIKSDEDFLYVYNLPFLLCEWALPR
jgi:hypothetical protein